MSKELSVAGRRCIRPIVLFFRMCDILSAVYLPASCGRPRDTGRCTGTCASVRNCHYAQVEWFERTYEENEELGLNDMNTEEFETLPEGYVRPPLEGEGDGQGSGASHLIPHRVGTDHPIAFTKGQEEEDNTVTDGVSTSTSTNEDGGKAITGHTCAER